MTDNPVIQETNGLRRNRFEPLPTPQYYPLVHSTFWIEYQFWRLNPAGFHIVNVLIHAGTCVVLWKTLRALNVPGAWLAAAIFGVHPVHVESVAWITERKNVLSGLCYLTSIYTVLPLLKLGKNDTGPKSPIRLYLIATLLFAGALLSKSVTCSLPAACLILIYWKRVRVTWRDMILMLPWIGLGAAAAMMTTWRERPVAATFRSVKSGHVISFKRATARTNRRWRQYWRTRRKEVGTEEQQHSHRQISGHHHFFCELRAAEA